jgi:hypothetical protein
MNKLRSLIFVCGLLSTAASAQSVTARDSAQPAVTAPLASQIDISTLVWSDVGGMKTARAGHAHAETRTQQPCSRTQACLSLAECFACTAPPHLMFPCRVSNAVLSSAELFR